jgi:hypothetical protein
MKVIFINKEIDNIISNTIDEIYEAEWNDRGRKIIGIVLICNPIDHLEIGQSYEADLSVPIRNSTIPSSIVSRYLIITCPDGFIRYFPLEHFLTLDEFRLRQLDKLDI